MAAGLFAARRAELIRVGRHDLVRWGPSDGPRLTALAPDPVDGAGLLAGVVFHMSRCGSTLLARLLAASAGTCVLREPSVVNSVLAGGGPDTATLLRRLVATCIVDHEPAATAVVLKGSSWNLAHADALRDAFPDTPVACVVRDPLEVLVSLVERTPAWLAPSASGATSEIELAMTVAACLDAAARAVDDRWLLVRYEELPGVAGPVARHFGLPEPADGDLADVARCDAKHPGRRWCPDGAAKRSRASSALRDADEAHTRPAFARLLAAFAASVPTP